MISVEEAKNSIQQNSKKLAPKKVLLCDAADFILAEDVFAITDIPGYNQSSMDGYAIAFSSDQNPLTLSGTTEILVEMAAGTTTQHILEPKHAMRIFTGAPLPLGADTVVMQEKIEVKENKLVIKDEQLSLGANVRLKGAEVRSGALAMPEGTFLSAAAIGFLAGIGIAEVWIYPAPSVTVILTGNELQTPGTPLEFGQVYEANGVMLTVALQKAGIKEINVVKVADDLVELSGVLQTALETSDVVLLTGGVSVGDYDFVVEATQACQVVQQFHKIKQKPGKPIFFGVKANQLIFGLPGNPSSVLTCFYEYVYPALKVLLHGASAIKVVERNISHAYQKPAGLTHFLKARMDGDMVIPLHAQESFRLHSYAQADCLICLPEDCTLVAAGALVEVHILPI
ncbi:molybdopterin molybdotransferase MoeA [Pedobacter duraquae]|uniref:Molybdopterin molybdenumtransferase n=1 Tax=Pedobacter duraquae TaxID=425511 RepID=A0A4R6IF78_9SPHI|nr:gephyrin-like molybdotransferase Glp [Pedobacter duraquae]TDO19565.1 molybdopterin molybdotransferase [Pedobacter duraquae]